MEKNKKKSFWKSLKHKVLRVLKIIYLTLFFKKNENKINYSKQYKKYLKNKRIKKGLVIVVQVLLLATFLVGWEMLAYYNIINSFIMSSPSKIFNEIVSMLNSGILYYHAWVTLYETLVSFAIATVLGTVIAVILWSNNFLRRVLDPYIVVLNSLPKIALGPIIIIWFGIGMSAIVFMAILIMIIITILSMLHSFNSCDPNKVLLLKSMNASRLQILCKLILPNAVPDFISMLKINVGLAWVGTIMGEYLVSQAGLGYLIIYGGQTFRLTLVMASTLVLCVLAALMYFAVAYFESKVSKSHKR